MTSTPAEFRTQSKKWREQKNRIGLFFVKAVVLCLVVLVVVIVIWQLSASKGEEKGTSQFLKDLAFLRQIRSISYPPDANDGSLKPESDECTTKECKDAAYFLLGSINPDTDPCDNFYNFTCGNTIGSFRINILQNSINKKIENLAKSVIETNDTKYIRLQKKYYHACMNVTYIEEDNNETMLRKLRQIGKWPILDGENWSDSKFKWDETMVKCRENGFYFDMLLTVVGCKMMNMRNDKQSYVLEVSPPYKVNNIYLPLKQKYTELMTRVVKILGAPENISSIFKSMEKVTNFEIELLKIIEETPPSNTHFDKTIEDIEKDYPFIPWSSYLKDVKIAREKEIIFNAAFYLQELKELLEKTPNRDLANYMLWKVIESVSAFLSTDIRAEFEKYANISHHYKFPTNREDYCYRSTKFMFPYLSEAEYVRQYVAEREAVKDMVHRMKSLLHLYVENSQWITNVNKPSLQYYKNDVYKKLENIVFIVGGTEEMYDESRFASLMGYDMYNISDLSNPLEIVTEVERKHALHEMNFYTPKYTIHQETIYKAISQVDSIKYMSSKNTLVVPAATFDGFLFSVKRPSYLNYGIFGPMVGQELSKVLIKNIAHKDGTNDIFRDITACLIKHCNVSDLKNRYVECEETLEKSFTSYVGTNLASDAYDQLYQEIGEEQPLPGSQYTSRQLFWIAHTSLMCDNESDLNKFSRNMLFFQNVFTSINITSFSEDFHCNNTMDTYQTCNLM